MKTRSPTFFIAALAATLAAVPIARGEPTDDSDELRPLVRPGMAFHSETGDGTPECTLAFLFRARGDIYAATAGHCLHREGDGPPTVAIERVYEPDDRSVFHLVAIRRDGVIQHGPRFGVGVYRGVRFEEDLVLQERPDLPPFMDFGLILLDKKVAYDPAMCFFGGPTGINDEITARPVLAHTYGAGEAVGYVSFTGTTVLPGRSGPVTLAHEAVSSPLVASSNDSGAPIMDAAGGAIATASSQWSLPRLTPALERVRQILGLKLKLLTAPLTDAPLAGRDPGCVP